MSSAKPSAKSPLGSPSAGAALPLMLAALAACGSEEAPRVSIPVRIDATMAARASINDLGYTVALTRARAALEDLQFTTAGESHLALSARLARWFISTAHAHPGHGSGGAVLGELPGPLVVDWLHDGAPLGTAVLLAGQYQGANFGFRNASVAELVPGDPLAGHTFHLEGTAIKGGRMVTFIALLNVDDKAALIGAPFDHRVPAGGTGALALRLLPDDPTDAADTLWNQVDFFALEGADSGAVRISAPAEAHNRLVRAFRTHDHYDVTLHSGDRR
jgi:hypothetical protein